MANNYSRNSYISPSEKIIAILSYFTFGFVGFIWIILGALLKQNLKPFLKFHIYQAIFLAFGFFIVSQLLIFIINILGYIPGINVLVGAIVFFFNAAIINLPWLHLTIIQMLVLAVTIYLSAGAWNGKFSYIPWVSNIIKYNIGQ
ncbi:MAG: hypothetical protein PHV37_07595 [Candidatus Gastranaerophilales bacterium]|nr:hypothetical protein [Candidatus Gastranaerophilales bacterium]